ncbi:hypothetical protein [Nonomuraea endophytica]
MLGAQLARLAQAGESRECRCAAFTIDGHGVPPGYGAADDKGV